MKLPIGYDNFGHIQEHHLDFVDKTLFIKDLLDTKTTQVTIITRPRRFGKTLNLSMLHHFLAPYAYGEPTAGLFEGLNITKAGQEYMDHQGKYPVIFVTFKDVKDHRYESAYGSLCKLMAQLYREYESVLLSSTKLTDSSKKTFQSILEERANEASIHTALQDLSFYLYQHYGVKPWLLMDEYDTPIQSAYVHGYYQNMLNLMRNLFGAVLKSNAYLNRAVITGILRIAKESLFSGLNNVEVYTLLQSCYSEYFGFTEAEVESLLHQSNLNDQSEAIRGWYNGYQCGATIIYNPWSIVNCIKQRGELSPYWVNTSDNAVIKSLLARADPEIKDELTSLILGESIQSIIDENIIFADLEKNKEALWSLMLFSGYLKAIRWEKLDEGLSAELSAPNLEVMRLYKLIIQSWFIEGMGSHAYQAFLTSLIEGRINEFTRRLQDYLLESASVFDVSGHHPEKFYHGFVMGLIISLRETHEVQSNRESGYGRYDVILIPKNSEKLGIILEFKVATSEETDLNISAYEALEQIEKRQYAKTLDAKGIHNQLSIGLAFRGKDVAVVAREI